MLAMLRCWGLNLRPVHCPECRQKMALLRLPARVEQLLFGGWTCDRCGCEMDKWGEPVEYTPPSKELLAYLASRRQHP